MSESRRMDLLQEKFEWTKRDSFAEAGVHIISSFTHPGQHLKLTTQSSLSKIPLNFDETADVLEAWEFVTFFLFFSF